MLPASTAPRPSVRDHGAHFAPDGRQAVTDVFGKQFHRLADPGSVWRDHAIVAPLCGDDPRLPDIDPKAHTLMIQRPGGSAADLHHGGLCCDPAPRQDPSGQEVRKLLSRLIGRIRRHWPEVMGNDMAPALRPATGRSSRMVTAGSFHRGRNRLCARNGCAQRGHRSKYCSYSKMIQTILDAINHRGQGGGLRKKGSQKKEALACARASP